MAALRALGLLPLPVLHSVGATLGEAIYWCYGARRRIALRNIERCFPHLNRTTHSAIARQHFRELGQSSLSVGLNWWASHKRLERLVRVCDRHHYDQALAAGRNVILLAPHFVALEIGGIFLSRERPMISMYQKTRNALLDDFVRRGRGRFGGVMVERKADLRDLVRQIRQGKPFYYLPDQDPGRRRGVFAPFFGIPTSTFPMINRFARMTDALVIPCFTRQLPRGRGYEIIFHAPLADFPSGDPVADATAMNAAIEDGVRMMPDQYFWVHKRFKTRPLGEPDFYA